MSAGVGRSRWLAVFLALAALAVTLLGIVVGTAVRSQRTSEYCTQGCHVGTPDHSFSSAGHGAVSCQSCHGIAIGAGLRLALSRSVGGKASAAHGAVRATSCTACHGPKSDAWPRVAATEGHRTHPTGVAALDCLSCHRTMAHGRQDAAAVCGECHGDSRLHDRAKHDEGPKPQCLSCHNFSVPRPDDPARAELTTTACGRCHSEGVQRSADVVPATVVRAEDLHGDVDCKQCHQPHEKQTRPPKPCRSCHQIQILSGSPNLPEEHVKCESCHQQHQPLAKAGSLCVKCHEQARARSEASASTALKHDECASCHLPHTWAAAPNECVTCHKDEANLVAAKSPLKHQRCNNCHEVHGNPPSGAVCGSCHKPHAAKQRNAPAKHQDCTSCHKSHAPSVQVPATCAECHKAALHQLVSLGPGGHMKATCSGCHAVHGNPRADTKTCSACHKEKSAQAAKAGVSAHTRCESCHAPHRFSVDSISPPCGKCHAEINTSSGSHGGKCVNCHVSHGNPSVPRDKCIGCHEKIQFKAPPGNAQHARCSSCHEPHRAALGAAKQCVSCHADKQKVAALWPASSAHRDSCEKCHAPHNPRAAVSCGGCHQKAQSSAAGGKHQCKQCHAPHQAPAEGKGWWNRCASCHATQAAASKSHAPCQNCHKPHAYKPPDCKSCHAEAAGKAAHAAKEHAVCGKCHDAHSATLPGRAECVSCHTDRTNHQPQAQRCYGCHPFK